MPYRAWNYDPNPQPYGISGGVDIPGVPGCLLLQQMSQGCLTNSQPSFLIFTFFDSRKRTYYQKYLNQITLNQKAL